MMAGTSQPADILASFVLPETSSLFDDTKTDETSDTVAAVAAITLPRGVSAVSADQTTDGLSDGRLTDEDSADEEAIIDAESVDNLFAGINEGLLEDLLAV